LEVPAEFRNKADRVLQDGRSLFGRFKHDSFTFLQKVIRQTLKLTDYYFTRLTALFSTTTWASRYQKGKTSLDLNEARDDRVLGWQWHQLDHMQTIYTSL